MQLKLHILVLLALSSAYALKAIGVQGYRGMKSRLFSSCSHPQSKILYENLRSALVVEGKVLKGYGRGSRQLGFPTANLPQFDKHIEDAKLLNGVYCGWSKLFINKNEISSNQRNYIAKPCVINIGISPTFVGKENPVRIIEVYLMSDDNNENNLPKDFYGNTLRLFITTFMRPEWKFTSIASLIEQINTDVQNAKSILRENSSSPIIDKEINHWIMNCDHLMTENEKVDSIFWKEVPISNMN